MTTIRIEASLKRFFMRHVLIDWAARLGEAFRVPMKAFIPCLTRKPWTYFLLAGLKSRQMTTIPLDLHLADPALAHEFYHGRFALSGRIVRTGSTSPWDVEPPSQAFEEALHDFSWLRHMKAAQTTIAAAYARTLVDEWITNVTSHANQCAWEARVASRRVISWLSHADLLLSGASSGFQSRFFKSLAFNLRYVRITHFFMSKAQAGQLDVSIALCFAALALETAPIQLRVAEQRLERAFEAEILPDGGHISRNPAALVSILADVTALCHGYQQKGWPVPEKFTVVRERIDRALRFFLHRDHTLANFNGVGPIVEERLNGILNIHATTSPSSMQAPYSGYQRLAYGATTVLVDTGYPPPRQTDALAQAHAGCLSFEMSSSAHRFIVNCGIDPNGRDEFRSLGRLTAAHSTATLNDTSSARLRSDRRGRNVLRDGPDRVRIRQIERPDCMGFIACHNGYGRSFNLLHQRSMVLSHDGNLLQGSDRFVKIVPSHETQQSVTAQKLATVRFHLHPDVEVSHLDSRTLRLEVMRADVWILTSQIDMYLEDSIYFCGCQGPLKTHQVVFSFDPDTLGEVCWAFQREVRKQSHSRLSSC